ncbi:MAG: hypothetical protein E6H59_07790 [Betaproteobacteria bacterium]|nr:MAG: hypothetical protein E6H59_07790 [Betaproteobacteria bacterium]
MKSVLALAALLVLSSCAQQGFHRISDPSTRVDVSGVSVLPPQEPGWQILQRSTFQLALGKRGPQPDATYVASVILYKLPDVDSEAQFLKLISERRLSEPDTGRFRIVKNAEEISHRSEVYCVKYHTISEDHAARTSSGVGSMLSEMMGYHCQHPKNKNVGVNFQYSHRHYPGDEDPLIGKKAAEFLEDVKFIAF